jgi:hypothetical protein
MKASDRTILAIGLILVISLGFWMLILSPKRQQANDLSTQVDELQTSVADQDEIAAYGEQARREFPKYYGRLVVLGKAVPGAADSASLLVQMSKVSKEADVGFKSIELGTAAGGATPPPDASVAEQASSPSATDAPAEGDTTTTDTTATDTTATDTSTVAPATEASAAGLPIGASVGAGGLPVLPYNLTFDGDFFSMADFIGGIDDLVDAKDDGNVAANGRLLTIDGFALTADSIKGFPFLQGNFAVTAYAAPSSEGATLGAAPTGPALVAPETTTTSATVSP